MAKQPYDINKKIAIQHSQCEALSPIQALALKGLTESNNHKQAVDIKSEKNQSKAAMDTLIQFANEITHNLRADLGVLQYNHKYCCDYQLKKLAQLLSEERMYFSELNIIDCVINIESAGGALLNALQNRKNPISVTLIRCNIGNAGAIALAKLIQENCNIVTLYLADNNIGNEGALALAEALKTNTKLKCLDLGYNKFNEPAIKTLLEVIKVNKTVSVGVADIIMSSETRSAFLRLK